MHRNPAQWPEPERFDPARWEPAAAGDEGGPGAEQSSLPPRHPQAFQAFSGGPRNCVGAALARAEALSVAAPLFRRYRFEVSDEKHGEREPEDHHVIKRKPKHGVYFRLYAR